jgi:hypothetical protein
LGKCPPLTAIPLAPTTTGKVENWIVGVHLCGHRDTYPTKAALVRYKLKLCQCDPDLASVREEKERAKLPEAERKEWQALWADVANLIAEKK